MQALEPEIRHRCSAAGIFGAMGNNGTVLRRDDIQPLGNVFPDAPLATATGADQAIRLNDLFDTRKVRGREHRLAAHALGCGLAGALSAWSSAWVAAIAVSKSSSARSNCSGSAFSDLRPKAACFKAATSFSSRSIRSSLRTSRSCDAISIAFRDRNITGRSTASNMQKVFQTCHRLAVGIYELSHHDAPTRLLLALLSQRSGTTASRARQTALRTGHVQGPSDRPGCLAK